MLNEVTTELGPTSADGDSANPAGGSGPEEIARLIEEVPAWMVRDEPAGSVEEIILAAARKSFLHERYKEALKQEDRFWGQEAHNLLSRSEVPRWVDARRHGAQYTRFGKASWVELYGVLFHDSLRRLFTLLRDREGPILELGCGCGWLSLELARQGKDVVAVDASRASLDLARFFYDERRTDVADFAPDFCGFPLEPPEKQGRVKHEFGDLNSLRIPAASFGAVIAWEALHHVHNPEGLADQVRHGLRKDGLFIVHETVHENVHGAPLCLFLTKRLIMAVLALFLRGRERRLPEPRASQELFFRIFRNAFPVPPIPAPELHSPFEAVSGLDMIRYFEKEFDVLHKSGQHFFLTEEAAFTIIRKWTERLGFAPPPGLTTPFFRFLKKCDDLIVKFPGIRPRHVFLVLRPKRGLSGRLPVSLREKAEEAGGAGFDDAAWNSRLLTAAREAQAAAGEGRKGKEALRAYSAAHLIPGRLVLKDPFSGLMLRAGWYALLGDFRWTNGNASLCFHFPAGSHVLKIVMKGAPNASPAKPQEVTLSLPGRVLAGLRITQAGWQTYEIPLSGLPAGLTELVIHSEVFIPRDLGISESAQVRGVAVRSLQAVAGE